MGLFTKLLARQELESGAPQIFAEPAGSRMSSPPPEMPPPTEPEPSPAEPVGERLPEATGEPLKPEESPVSGEDPGDGDPDAAGFGDLLEDFFESVVGTGDEPETEEGGAEEAPQLVVEGESAAELRATFSGVAAQHLLPVRQMHRRLQAGPVSVDWVGLCRPAVAAVGRTAVEMNLVELVRPLDQLAALLSSADRQGGQEVVGAIRDSIQQACEELVELFPEAFVGDDDPDARDHLVVHALLRQVPQLGTVSLDKIFAAGLTTMTMLASASAEDLAATTGISLSLADQVRGAVDCYLAQTASLRDGGSPLDVLGLLVAAVAELEQQHAAYRETPDTQQGSEQRRGHRRARRLAQLRAHTYLAALGEAPLVEELQLLPLDRTLDRLHRFIQALRPGHPVGTRTGGPVTGVR